MKLFPSVHRSILPAALFFAGALTTSAQTSRSTTDIPRTISYQGLLSSTDGKPIPDGEQQVTVTLYSDPQGTQPVWRDTYSTYIVGGIFNLYLGQEKPLPDLSTMNAPLWVGTSVNGTEEMRPLTALSASPYALNVPNGAITTEKIADGAITAEKVEMEYLGGLQIDGEKISAKGTVLNIVGTPSVPLSYDQETQRLTIGKLPAAIVDREKGARAQASPLAWDSQGDLTDGTAGGQNTTAGDWIGTSSAAGNGQYDFEFRTEGEVVMLYQTSGAGSVPNIIGGQGNTISAAAVQSSIIAEGTSNTINAGDHNAISGGESNTIAAGGAAVRWGVIAGGQENNVDADYSTIGGGVSNSIRSPQSTISGGQSNTIGSGVFLATIGGGGGNTVTAAEATIAGGHRNQVHSYVSFVGGGHDNYIWRSTDFSTIGGGLQNVIGDATGTATTTHSTIAGGQRNQIGVAGGSISHSLIGGGIENLITSSYSTIGGGNNNQVYSATATIGGGEQNVVADNSPYAFIGGGQGNIVNANHTVIGGGEANNVIAIHSTIGGGWQNVVSGTEATIGGGQNNRVSAQWGTIAGGANNGVTASMGTVGGGENNQVTASEATIAGGHRNQVHAYVSVVGGGHNNFIWQNSTYSTISGGLQNAIGNSALTPPVTHSFVGGGQNNTIGSTGGSIITHSTIGGGQSNSIGTPSGLQIDHSTIGGGQENSIQSPTATIGGGINNVIGVNSFMATIGGGGQNTARAPEVTIAGGHRNTVESYVSAVGGGHNNTITANSEAGFIGGGRNNTVDGRLATIGGGQENTARGTHTTIPGGDKLTTATSYAQSAMGFMNAPRGAMALRPNTATIAASNDPLFMVGNGDVNANAPSNAFEVSYNGHSTVYGVNGTGAGNPAIEGATYVDNVVYAWGDIAAGGGINSDFGVLSIAGGGGVYDITINVTDPLGNPITLNNASITATVVDNPDGKIGCAMITTTQIGVIAANTFRIRTYVLSGDVGCKEADLPFMFKVTGRQ